jgi:CubicO group peptidase (beta-lactamase class C family)
VTTTLIAIAADQGYFDLEQTVVSIFPNRTIANLDERKARMMIRDLVTMRNGMESGCIATDLENLDAIRVPSGWVQAALDRPMAAEPGTEFCYDSPGFHILSAILQETTGMTELEFARKNLFEPLGIQDAIWDIDPQGYNLGWGDLYLTPESAAKIGLLFLHHGKWDGRQLVPEAWVVDSVHPHSHPVDHDYGYGYGWWINNSHYFAAGRGGQEIRVIPSMDTVVVMTGGFFDPTEVISRLTLPVLLSGRPRPADPEGLAMLQETLASIQFNDTLPAVFSSPETAQEVSGRLYMCEENVIGLDSVRFDFSDPDMAVLYHRSYGEDIVWPIGLDGQYRSLDPDGDGLLGYWEDDQTFHLEIFDLGTQVFQVKFQENSLQLISPEAGLMAACQAQTH